MTSLGKLILHFNTSPWLPPPLQVSPIVLYTLELDITFFTFLNDIPAILRKYLFSNDVAPTDKTASEI